MPVTRRGFMARAAASGAALGLAAALPAQAATHAFGGLAFGSAWRISGGIDLDEAHLRPLVEAALSAVDATMSPWREDSSISRFNTSQTAHWQPMPQDLCSVVAESLEIARVTDGAFDPTVGPAVARFGFGRIQGGSGSLGSVEVGDGAIRKAERDLTLDLCGIAKGHALDRLVALLRGHSVTSALVELGGEVAAIGEHPAGRPWQVAIERPGSGRLLAHRILAPGSLSLASSGHAPNGYRGRVALSHLIDPHTWRPADNRLASVSVLASTGARADALATAFTVLGAERGVERARELGVAALFLIQTDTGLREIMTGRFADHVIA